MSRTLKVILAINLLLLVALTFAWPHLMVGPGKLIPGHQALGTDCFACHSAFTGVSAAKCVGCHKPAEIGKLTTLGTPIAKPLSRTPLPPGTVQPELPRLSQRPRGRAPLPPARQL
jgi:hypothetical protein